MNQTILITGGLGFIGSHTCVELLNKNYNIVVIDNLSNSKITVLDSIKKLSPPKSNISYYNINLCNYSDVNDVFLKHKINSVIHFAGLKSVNESIANPLLYYDNNISMTVNLLKIMNNNDCKNIIFSSSATVYGTPQCLPICENNEIGKNLLNPYGKTKFFIEEILRDLFNSDNEWSIVILRYFNPVGAHKSGLLCEDPNNIPNNLMPYVLDVASKKYNILSIFGNDYDTTDGTCIRDFIHVVDLADGHICALTKLSNPGIHTYNLGSGKGTSVLELVNSFIEINNIPVNYKFEQRRCGDTPILYADATKAYNELGWKTKLTIKDMCKDSWIGKQQINHNI